MQQLSRAALIVLGICIGVVLLAPFIAQALPTVIVVVIVLFLASRILSGPRHRDR